jgi:hypothetical protein
MKKVVSLRVGPPVAVGFAVLLAGVAACSSSTSPNQPSNVAAAAPPAPQTLAITVKVTNTHFGNAVPSDFKLAVSYDGTAAATTTLDGSASALEVSVPRGSNYAVSVGALDGYTTTLSAGCSGAATSDAATCAVTASDVDMTCDKTLWDPVYTKDRLKVLGACEVATGVVVGTEIERDGDLEIWLTPDAKYSRLLRTGNQNSRNALVVEIPCQAPIVQLDAMGTCDKYTGPKMRVPLPNEHLVVAAPWVEDKTHYNWGELHGARIVKLPR